MRSNVLYAFLASTLMLGACAENIPELRVVANRPLDESCQPDIGNAVFIGRGVLDLFVTDRYVFAPQVDSELVASESIRYTGLAAGGAGGLQGANWEANDITLSRATVQYEAPASLGVPLLRSYDIPLSGSVEPGGSLFMTFDLVNTGLARTLAASPLLRQPGSSFTLNVRLQFFGQTNAGQEVDSNEFSYPIVVCNGCLLSYTPSSVDTAFPLPNCRNLEDFDAESAEIPCFPGQDERVDCRAVCATIIGDETADPFGLCDGG
jgi:hypothetical protein